MNPKSVANLFPPFSGLLTACFTCLLGCGASLKLRHYEDRLSESPIAWDHLINSSTQVFEPSPEYPIEPGFPLEDLARLAPRLGGNHLLAEIALRRSIRNPVLLDQGVYGKMGSATFFAAPLRRIPSYDRLYWVMMKVLSEKYGCFVTAKTVLGNSISFTCRDQRKVVMTRGKQDPFIHFYARQYDSDGAELVVINHKVIARK